MNRVIDAGQGHIRLVGLALTATQGQAEVGRWRLHVAPNPPIGVTQPVTVTGEVNITTTGVVTIAPVDR